MKTYFTIQQIADKIGLSVHTLRYYEKIELLTEVQRDANGYRQYTESDIAWIHFLLRLRATGMPIREMQQFSHLRSRGDSTIRARRALLEEHQEQVMAQVKELHEHLLKIESKIEHYKRLEENPVE
ncbi:MerR family transcriptional regulator [Paenibacillus sp. KS1]|uniref:MerR family transcriptional regulator n=1 Tax=Paenibacillus sp. KS1 TaxID=1849249 RepID=UPI0008065EC6|nr:MerR family transcriptional regulator [Paenibacillus sp. KS1]OBY78696.1 MerR family transcriptional regulator [Paenibacillus sp. KS1]